MTNLKNSELEYVHEVLQLARGFISRKSVWSREEMVFEEERTNIDENSDFINPDGNIVDENGWIKAYSIDRQVKTTSLKAINDASYLLKYQKNGALIRNICCLLIYKRILQYTGNYNELVSDIDNIPITKIEDTINQWNKTVDSHKDIKRIFDEAISVIDKKMK